MMKRILLHTGLIVSGACAFATALAFHCDTIRLESPDGRYRSARVRTDGQVRLVRKLSDTPCRIGRNWGYDDSHIWVDDGCRAIFEYGRDSRGDHYGDNDRYDRNDRYGRNDDNGNGYRQGNYRRVEVSSNTGRRVYRHIENDGVELLRTLSDHPCRQGRTWGYDYGGIWVDDGCRAEFAVRIR